MEKSLGRAERADFFYIIFIFDMATVLTMLNAEDGLMKKAAHYASLLVSAVFSPVVLPLFTFSAILLSESAAGLSPERKWLIWCVCMLSTTFVVSGYVVYLKVKGLVGNLDLDVREERKKPFVVGLASHIVGFALVYALNAPPLITWLMFCYITNTLLVQIITQRWKVSIHATGIGGACVAWAFQFGSVVAPLFALVPIVGVSRVVLHKHTVGQVIVGSLIGLCLTALQLRYFLR
jgi:membrane-associated phospholipid phosphatase